MIEINNKAEKKIHILSSWMYFICKYFKDQLYRNSNTQCTKVKESKWAQRQTFHFSCSAVSAVTKCYFKVLLQNLIKCRKQCRDLVTNFSIMNKHAELYLYLLL